MLSTDIAPADWRACLDAFSRRHAHATATIEVHEPQHGAAGEVFEGPFVGAEVEHDPDGHESIFVSIGDGEAHWSRVIAHPKLVSIYRDLDGGEQALEIESDDGGYTSIRL